MPSCQSAVCRNRMSVVLSPGLGPGTASVWRCTDKSADPDRQVSACGDDPTPHVTPDTSVTPPGQVGRPE
ncbi:hypothetical protein MSEN_20090 [Mycolicibacter senuensis]|uniref:Uncharacterized protein n=1 Tax=Mycolicibacter senuensis TaxID=386913 RepID=A0A7I9XK42_9MYCO|nr:hypothetical protein MSEN_20090 [Mycolicibacter senuensis]